LRATTLSGRPETGKQVATERVISLSFSSQIPLPVKKRCCFGLLAVVKKVESFRANFT
jgi:hypothetical protein